jgi:hypothetical protein
MARSIENPKPAGPVIISVSGRKLDNFYFLGSAIAQRLAPFEREKPAIRSLVATGLTSVVSI